MNPTLDEIKITKVEVSIAILMGRLINIVKKATFKTPPPIPTIEDMKLNSIPTRKNIIIVNQKISIVF